MLYQKITVNTLVTDTGDELVLEFAPHNADDAIVCEVGDRIVLGYLVHDDSPSFNPLTDSDCQGNLYTKAPYCGRDRTITDNAAEFYGALGMDRYGDIDWDLKIPVETGRDSICNVAAANVLASLNSDQLHTFLAHLHRMNVIDLTDDELSGDEWEAEPEFAAWCEEARTERYRQDMLADLVDPRGYHEDKVYAEIKRLYTLHWKDIVGPFVVPVYANTGNYDSVYRPTAWDGDVDDLPDGVWVADKGAIENIGDGCREGISITFDYGRRGGSGWGVRDGGVEVKFFPDNGVTLGRPTAMVEAEAYVESHYGDRPMDLHTAAVNYAAGVLDEYSKWCSGEVYGCVVQVFTRDGDEWKPNADHDSCWGFIGHEYALEALRSDFVDPVVGRLQNALLSAPSMQTEELVTAVESEGGHTD